MGPMLGFDPVPRFSASCGPLVGGPPPVGWPPTLTSEVRALSAKMAGAQVVPHEGIPPSGFCRLGPGSVVAWRASGPPHVGTWFFQSVHSGPSGVSGIGHRWFPPWGPGFPDHSRMEPLSGDMCGERAGPQLRGPIALSPCSERRAGGRRRRDTKPDPNDEGSWLLPPW